MRIDLVRVSDGTQVKVSYSPTERDPLIQRSAPIAFVAHNLDELTGRVVELIEADFALVGDPK